jgi:hypothetical protein
MFCPRCGAATEVRDSRLYCTGTDMDFSEVVAGELTSVVDSAPDPPTPSKVKWGGKWFCPADATRMHELGGIVECPNCRRSLPPRLLYGLIEFHVHPRRR